MIERNPHALVVYPAEASGVIEPSGLVIKSYAGPGCDHPSQSRRNVIAIAFKKTALRIPLPPEPALKGEARAGIQLMDQVSGGAVRHTDRTQSIIQSNDGRM